MKRILISLTSLPDKTKDYWDEVIIIPVQQKQMDFGKILVVAYETYREIMRVIERSHAKFGRNCSFYVNIEGSAPFWAVLLKNTFLLNGPFRYVYYNGTKWEPLWATFNEIEQGVWDNILKNK